MFFFDDEQEQGLSNFVLELEDRIEGKVADTSAKGVSPAIEKLETVDKKVNEFLLKLSREHNDKH